MNEDLLKKIPLFASVDNATLRELAVYMKNEVFPPHQTIFWMDEKGEQLYIVLSGKVHIGYTNEDGREITLNILGPNTFFGELSLLDGGPHTATARTMEETTLLTLDRESFYLFLDGHPQVSNLLLKVLSARLRNSTVKIRGVMNVNEQVDAKQTTFQRFIDNIARALTSSIFLGVYIVLIVGWMLFQVILWKKTHHKPISFSDQPPTFAILEFLITLTSFLLTILILNSQRRQAENDRIRGEIEYQVNLKSQTEVMKLQLKMNQLVQMVNKFMEEKNMNK